MGAALPLILRHSVRFQMLMRFGASCAEAQLVSDCFAGASFGSRLL